MTVLSAHLVALLACSGARTPPAATPAPAVETSAVEAPAVEVSVPVPVDSDPLDGSALMAAGACSDASMPTPSAVTRQTLADGREVLLVVCENFAYQSSFEYWSAAPMAPLKTKAGATLSGLGVPTMAADGTLDWLEKARGVGDCGTSHAYASSGDVWLLKAKRSRGCEDTVGDPGKPETWPLVATTGVLHDLQNGDRGCYVVLKDDTNIIGEFDLCMPEIEALKGKLVALEMVTADTQSPECEGDPECSLSISEQLVVSVTPL